MSHWFLVSYVSEYLKKVAFKIKCFIGLSIINIKKSMASIKET